MTSRALIEAIDYATADRLRMTLKNICEKSAVARELVGAELMVDSRGSSEEPPHPPPQLSIAAIMGNAYQANSRKRPSVQFIECVRCNRKFESVNDDVGDCIWHDGTLNIDEDHDVWSDACERTFGEDHPMEFTREMPEGFVWSCCGGRGNASGCRRGPHQAREVSIKRVRI